MQLVSPHSLTASSASPRCCHKVCNSDEARNIEGHKRTERTKGICTEKTVGTSKVIRKAREIQRSKSYKLRRGFIEIVLRLNSNNAELGGNNNMDDSEVEFYGATI